MHRLFAPLAAATFLAPAAGLAEVPAVLVSIKPIHSLVSSLMQGVGEPALLVPGASSPHNFSLKPSDAAHIAEAGTIFWVGESLEVFLEEPLTTLGENAHIVELAETRNLILLPVRDDAAFEPHDDEHGDEHEHEEEHGHEDEHEDAEDHDQHAEDDHGHEDHGHDGIDPHIWLDPVNAKAMVKVIEGALISADPNHATIYINNSAALLGRLDALIGEVDETLAPARGVPFIVFHDAYQYFEARFGVAAAGSITVSPEVQPGAKRIREIREKLKDLEAACVFSEPQFPPRLIGVVTEGTDVRTATLDPLGADLPEGPDLYFDLIRHMGLSLRTCLLDRTD